MNVRILGTGSDGNCSIIEDINGNQIIIDLGFSYDKIAPYIKYNKALALVTHLHTDHYDKKTVHTLSRFGLDIYTPSNFADGVILQTSKPMWIILPIKVPHSNTPCFAFIIYNSVEKKSLLWATDLSMLPNLAKSHNYHFMAIECNYMEDIVKEKVANNEPINRGCQNHLSLDSLVKWLSVKDFNPEHLCIIHQSNSGLFVNKRAEPHLLPLAKNLYFSRRNLFIQF